MAEKQQFWAWTRPMDWYVGGWLTIILLRTREDGAAAIGYVFGEGFVYMLALWAILSGVRAIVLGVKAKLKTPTPTDQT